MTDLNYLPFPYKVENISPEEQEYVNKVYGTTILPPSIRIGPKGYIIYEPYKTDAANIYNMPLRPTDIFVASYPRSGTTWVQELVWLLANNLDYKTAAEIQLTHRFHFLDQFIFFDPSQIDKYVKIFESKLDEQVLKGLITMLGKPASGMVASIPESVPRFIKTHIPISLMNPKMLDTSKVVYVARDPRDVAVSCYHHARLFKMADFRGNFKEFWNMFRKGFFYYGAIFEHVKEAWNLRHHRNMLFLFYEDLSKDLPSSVRRVAHFLGKDLNKEEIDRLCNHLSFKSFKNNKSVNYEEMRTVGLLATGESFIRKGKIGGWRDYFDEEMTLQAEQWITDNLRDTDLRYPHMNIIN